MVRLLWLFDKISIKMNLGMKMGNSLIFVALMLMLINIEVECTLVGWHNTGLRRPTFLYTDQGPSFILDKSMVDFRRPVFQYRNRGSAPLLEKMTIGSSGYIPSRWKGRDIRGEQLRGLESAAGQRYGGSIGQDYLGPIGQDYGGGSIGQDYGGSIGQDYEIPFKQYYGHAVRQGYGGSIGQNYEVPFKQYYGDAGGQGCGGAIGQGHGAPYIGFPQKPQLTMCPEELHDILPLPQFPAQPQPQYPVYQEQPLFFYVHDLPQIPVSPCQPRFPYFQRCPDQRIPVVPCYGLPQPQLTMYPDKPDPGCSNYQQPEFPTELPIPFFPFKTRIPVTRVPTFPSSDIPASTMGTTVSPAPRCLLPKGIDSADVKCKQNSTHKTCIQTCGRGFSRLGGTIDTMTCKLADDKWDKEKFSECFSYQACQLSMFSHGTVDCRNPTETTPYRCFVSCKKYENFPAVENATLDCLGDNQWNRELPHCFDAEDARPVSLAPGFEHTSVKVE